MMKALRKNSKVLDARRRAHKELLEISRKKGVPPFAFKYPGSMNQRKK